MAYKILSLDGGGTWALVQVKVLQQRYGQHASGHEVLKNYDMVIANSGGSLVLAAMCVNKKLSDIAKIFMDENILDTIFVERIDLDPFDVTPRFKTDAKLDGLREQLGSESKHFLTEFPSIIGKESLELIITGFDYDRERAVYFRSNPKSRMESCVIQKETNPNEATDSFKTTSLLNAVHAASTAPVMFFDAPALFSYHSPSEPNKSTAARRFWDGAIGGNNNPVASGILEAIANGAKTGDIKVISIGTGNTILPIIYNELGAASSEFSFLVKNAQSEGLMGDIKKLAQAIISDPPDAATFIAHHILGLPYTMDQNSLIRINPLLKPILDRRNNKWMRPGLGWDEDDLETLMGMDMAVTRYAEVQLIDRMTEQFFDGYFQNQGIRLGGTAIEPILGHATFKSAFDAWISWDLQA